MNAFPRALTDAERRVAEWMLRSGDLPDVDRWLSQLRRAEVGAGCQCGCATIELTVQGEPRPAGGIRILGDYLYRQDGLLCGAFVYERSGVLAGLEFYTMQGLETPRLPEIAALRRLEDAWTR
jgi:hypothetical protein